MHKNSGWCDGGSQTATARILAITGYFPSACATCNRREQRGRLAKPPAGEGVGSRFRATACHVARLSPKTTPDPFAQHGPPADPCREPIRLALLPHCGPEGIVVPFHQDDLAVGLQTAERLIQAGRPLDLQLLNGRLRPQSQDQLVARCRRRTHRRPSIAGSNGAVPGLEPQGRAEGVAG